MADLDTLRPEVAQALGFIERNQKYGDGSVCAGDIDIVRAELVRLADENARLNKIESLATEQRLQMEDVELYLMDVSQPDDEDAPWCDRMKSAIELLIQDCNDAVGQKNKAEAELAAIKARIAEATVGTLDICYNGHAPAFIGFPTRFEHDSNQDLIGKRVRLVVEE